MPQVYKISSSFKKKKKSRNNKTQRLEYGKGIGI